MVKRKTEKLKLSPFEANTLYGYIVIALIALANAIFGSYPTPAFQRGILTFWAVIGFGVLCLGLGLRKGKLRNKFLSTLLLGFAVLTLVFVLFLSFFHPALVD